MSLSITQTPANVSLAQSPIVFTVNESSGVIYSSSFQYNADLYYWNGTPNQSGSLKYQLVKYPNASNVGIFDMSRIVNSTLTDLAQANSSNVKYFAADFYWQYWNGTSFVTGSHTKSSTYKALDGYAVFQEAIGEAVQNKTDFWPIMSDGPAIQNTMVQNMGTMGVYVGTTGGTQPNKVIYTSINNGSVIQTVNFTLSGSVSSSQQVQQIPIGPAEDEWPLSSINNEFDFTIQAAYNSTLLGAPIYFSNICQQKYPNIRIKWKNRFGQFDYFNFYMVNRQSFQTEKRTYQPQLGSWQGSSLSYQNYDSSVLNYISDSKQAISVNTFYIDEAYNEIIKQLLVSDEMYWIYDEANNNLRPITIVTDSITFKTGVNDKLIQYAFDFNWGQAYKLIL
jgi:hypothetical protein